MPETDTTCHGISFTRFPAGANLLLVTCPAMALQAIMSIASHKRNDTERVRELLSDMLIPLMDAIEAQPRHGVQRGTAVQAARPINAERIPWSWEGRVRIERPDELVIDAERALSAVSSRHLPDVIGADAFARAHPWLNRALIDAEDRKTFMENLTDRGLEAQAYALCEHRTADLVNGASMEHRAAYTQAIEKHDAQARIRLLAEMLRAHLTNPRFPTLALALPDTHGSLTWLADLLDGLVGQVMSDTTLSMIPS